MGCSDEETTLKKQMREIGMNPDDFEGCGYVPILEKV